MLLLHISDIHFRYPECQGDLDPELPYREHLINHASQRVAVLGDVGAILVTGDIAFCGLPEEYDVAKEWLERLAHKVGCTEGRIYVVPGNHDVNRNVFNDELLVRQSVAAIFAEPDVRRRERALLDAFNDEAVGKLLFKPIKAYNQFAAAYDCQLSRKRPFWTEGLPIGPKAAVSLRGMTSTFLSGLNGDDNEGELFLGAMQAGLPPKDGVVHLAMAHHPPNWMSDNSEIRRRLQGEPAILLFGHEHEQWLTRDVDGSMLVRAGSVQPERYELGWQPAYNFIDLAVQEKPGGWKVRARIWQYHWQQGPNMFVAQKHRNQNDYADHVIALHGEWTPPDEPAAATAAKPADAPEQIPTVEENALSGPDTRDLIYRFWKLRRSRRKELMVALGVLDADERITDEPTQYRTAMVLLAQQGRLTELETAIHAKE